MRKVNKVIEAEKILLFWFLLRIETVWTSSQAMGEFMDDVRQSTVGNHHKLNWKKFPNVVESQKTPEKMEIQNRNYHEFWNCDKLQPWRIILLQAEWVMIFFDFFGRPWNLFCMFLAVRFKIL